MSEGLRLAKPNYIQFGILTPDQIKALSVVEVNSPRTLDENRRIVEHGLYDLRMGPQSRHGELCKTCGGDIDTCPGHFGHIELAEPIYHPFCDTVILRILNVICHNCGKLLLDPQNPKNISKWNELLNIKSASDRIALLVEMSANEKVCSKEGDGNDFFGGILGRNLLEPDQNTDHYIPTGCGATHLKVVKDNSSEKVLVIKRIRGNSNDYEILSCKKVLDILSLMKDDEVRLLGLDPRYTHPRNFVLTRLPVIPTIARTSVQTDAINSSPDDLTTLLAHIIECNYEIKASYMSKASTTKATEDSVGRLRKLIKVYIDNNDSKLMVRDKQGRQLKGINQQIKGKNGLIRLNLMGKRLDFTARTVISGDPTISIEQVGVPESVAKTMTYEETVTDYNIEELRKMVQNGDTYPGAKTITPVDGVKMLISALKNNPDCSDIQSYIKKGAKVERHMKDGDFVLFNRQPTLHKVSIMGHRVKVMKYSTFRLNLSVTTPYNADFDGDEMNLHLPQGHAARAEIKHLMLVPENVVVSQMNAPIIGIVQDSLLACYLMTRRNVLIERQDVMNLMMWLDEWEGKLPEPAIMYPKKLWTGKQIFSTIIPERINMEGYHPSHNQKDNSFNPVDDTHVYIRKGELMMGMLSGAQLGSGKRGIIHVIWLDLGPDATKTFINGIQRITMNWLLLNGFSVGIGDMVPSDMVKNKVRGIISHAIDETNKLFYRACQGNIDRAPGQTPLDAFEVEVQKMLKNTGSENGKIIKDTIHSMNNIRSMVISGSKGNDLNLAQIIGCLGQQSLMGGRIPFKFLSHRALPHFSAYDYSAPAKGYVQNSYLLGLNPAEFFFHAIGGREGVIDTAVKTADIGYTYQKMVKSLEDIVIEYDGTARRAEGEVIQLLFGDDGIDSIYMEMESLDWVLLSDKEYENRYRLRVLDKEKTVLPAIKIEPDEMDEEIAIDTNISGEELDFLNDEVDTEERNLKDDFVEWENERDMELFENTEYNFTKGLENVMKVPTQKLDGVPMVKRFGEGWLDSSIISELKSSPYEQKIIERYYQKIYKLREDYRISIENGSQSVVLGSIYTDNVMAIPMSIKRILSTAEINNKISTNEVCKLNPAECARSVLGLVEKLTELGMRNFHNERFSKETDSIKLETSQARDSSTQDRSDDTTDSAFNNTLENDIEMKQSYENMNRFDNYDENDYMDSNQALSGDEYRTKDEGELRTQKDEFEKSDQFDYTMATKKERRERRKRMQFKKTYGCYPNDINKPTTLFAMHIMHLMSPKQLCQIRRFNNDALQEAINVILRKFIKSQVSPGEAVGIVAAESIAQPMTQMTLNTFHSAGVANSTVTQGLPRLKEIIGAVEKIKTPSCSLKIVHNMPVERNMVALSKAQENKINFKSSSNMYYNTGIKVSSESIDNDGIMKPEDQAKYIQGSLAFTTVNSIERRRMVVYDPWECNEDDPKYEEYIKSLDKIIEGKAIGRQTLSEKQVKYYNNLRDIFRDDSQIIRLAENTGDGLPNAMLRAGTHSNIENYDSYNDDFDDDFGGKKKSVRYVSDFDFDYESGYNSDDTDKKDSRYALEVQRSSLDSFTSPWVIRFELNKGRMQERNFRTMDIKAAIINFVRQKHAKGTKSEAFGRNLYNGDTSINTVWKYITLYIQTSTDNSEKIIIRIRPRLTEELINKALSYDFPASAAKCYKLIESRDQNEIISKCLEDEVLHELSDMPFHFDVPFLKALQSRFEGRRRLLYEATDHPTVLLAKEIGNVYVCGIPDITAAYIRKQENHYTIDNNSNAIVKSEQWYVDTEGATKSSFKLLMRLWGIDWTKTMCNDPHIICETLGIEAARTLILNELRTVMLGASYVNGRHLKLIAEIMTAAGKLLSVDRNGLFKRDGLVLLKSSFEKPLITLLNAGFYSQNDKLCGMTEALMTANVVPVGTGRVSTLLDVNSHMISSKENEEQDEGEKNIYDGMEGTADPSVTDSGNLGPEFTPFMPTATPREGGLASILSGRGEISQGSVLNSIHNGLGVDLSPIRETSLSRQLSETMASCLGTSSTLTTSANFYMKSVTTSLSRRTSLTIITNTSSIISSKSNINQLSDNRSANNATVDTTSPTTYSTPANPMEDEFTPGGEFDVFPSNDSDHSQEDKEDDGDVEGLF